MGSARRAFDTAFAALFLLCTLPATAWPLDLTRCMVFDVPAERMGKQFGALPPALLSEKEMAAIAASQFDGDTLKVVVVLVEWSDRLHTHAPATFDSLFFSQWVFPGNSVADYYEEVSYGQLTVVGDVYGWHNAGLWDIDFDFEPLLTTLDPVIDFSQYDGNNDGSVDAVVFVRTGNGEEDSQDPADMWSYAVVYPPGSGAGPFDGKLVGRWNTCPETRPERHPDFPFFTGNNILNWIRVYCHELAHNLGLPDLYDYDAKLDVGTYNTPGDDNDHPLVDWCVMGYHGYGYMSAGSRVPSHFCGWSKMQLGWIVPEIRYPTETWESLTLKSIETNSDDALYMVPIDNDQGEYFLLEYRNPESGSTFDTEDSDFSVLFFPDLWGGADPLERGLIITHVHDSVVTSWPVNDGTPNYPHYRVAVEDAGYNSAMPVFSNPEGGPSDSAHWWYPWEVRKAAPFTTEVPGKNIFSPTSTPNSDGYAGPSGITVRVDSINGDNLYASIRRPQGTNWPQFAAHLVINELCQYNAPPGGVESGTLQINNFGTATLMAHATVIDGGSWLSLTGSPVTIPQGGAPVSLNLTMDATGLTPGIYEGEISIDHNDESQVSPRVFRIEFHVNPAYQCAERVTLRTAVASPGILALTLESAGRFGFGDQDDDDGLLRAADSSESVFDGSLILAHGSMNPDTIVFFSFYGNATDPGFRGFLSSAPMVIDTSAYGTGTGNATAESQFMTEDGILGVENKWYFPQNPDSADFVIARYRVTNLSGGVASDVIIADWIDFDVVPGNQFEYLQQGVNNHSHYVPENNLIYQYGYTKVGIPQTPPLLLAERYSAGIAYLSGRDYAGTGMPFADQQIALHAGTRDYREVFGVFFGGPIEQYLYATLSALPNVTLWEGFPHADSSSDALTFMVLDQGLTLTPGETRTYVVALLSDTLSHPDMPVAKLVDGSDLVTTAQKAAAWAANYNIYGDCLCPYQADIDGSGAIDAVDLAITIDVVFFGTEEVQDPDCPATRSDFNDDTVSDAVDLAFLIDHVFFGGDGPVDPCLP